MSKTFAESPCKRLEEAGECKETLVFELRSGDRRYPQRVKQQSRVGVCCDKEMEEAGCYHIFFCM